MNAATPTRSSEPGLDQPQESVQARRRRQAHRSRLYLYAVFSAALVIVIAALIIANTRTVTVSWIFGSTHQPLVWVVLATAALSWLLGILTSVLFRFRTRAPRDRAHPPGDVTAR